MKWHSVDIEPLMCLDCGHVWHFYVPITQRELWAAVKEGGCCESCGSVRVVREWL